MFLYTRFLFTIFFLILIILTAAISCSRNIKPQNTGISDSDIFKIWALADIQPKDAADRTKFEDDVIDVNRNVDNIDIAVVAGDIASKPDKEVYEWYNNVKNSSYIKNWYEIAGNHDLKYDDGELFSRMVHEKTNYSARFGNILIIFMSDSQQGKPTEISNKTFEWWKELVKKNQDKIIIVVTHAPLEGSSIPFSSFHDRQITKSKRFVKVLKNYNVDLWLSGHLHLPQAFINTVVKKPGFADTIFVHISSIRTELLGLKNSESRFITFFCGSNKIRVESRDHDSGKYHKDLEKEFNVSNKILCDAKIH